MLDVFGGENPALTAGKSVESKLRWLVDFAGRDLSDPEARAIASAEVHVFVVRHFLGTDGYGVAITQHATPDEIPAIQAALRLFLKGLVPGSSVWFNEAPFEPPFSIGSGIIWSKKRGVVLSTRAAGVPQVIAAVVDLLVAVGARLGRCKGCERLFVKMRPHQVNCTIKCGTDRRVAAWRKEKRERLLEARHQQYARKVKKVLPGAKVGRRPRSAVKK